MITREEILARIDNIKSIKINVDDMADREVANICEQVMKEAELELCRLALRGLEAEKLVEALEKIVDRHFSVTLPCECCDKGCESAPCTCFDYSISEEFNFVGEQAQEALSEYKSATTDLGGV